MKAQITCLKSSFYHVFLEYKRSGVSKIQIQPFMQTDEKSFDSSKNRICFRE